MTGECDDEVQLSRAYGSSATGESRATDPEAIIPGQRAAPTRPFVTRVRGRPQYRPRGRRTRDEPKGSRDAARASHAVPSQEPRGHAAGSTIRVRAAGVGEARRDEG
jgi:hypothetical protein